MFFKKRTLNEINLREVNEHRKHFDEAYPGMPVELMKKTSLGIKQLMILDVAAEDMRHRGDVDLDARYTLSTDAGHANRDLFIYPEKGLESFPREFLDYMKPSMDQLINYRHSVKKGEISHNDDTCISLRLADGWDVIKGFVVTMYFNAYFYATEDGKKFSKSHDGIHPTRLSMMKDALSYLTYYEHGDYEKREALMDELETFFGEVAIEAVEAVENAGADKLMPIYEKYYAFIHEGKSFEERAEVYHSIEDVVISDAVLHDTRVSDILKKYVSPYAVYWASGEHEMVDASKDFEPDTMWFTTNLDLFIKRAKKRVYPAHAKLMEDKYQEWLENYGPNAWKTQQ